MTYRVSELPAGTLVVVSMTGNQVHIVDEVNESLGEVRTACGLVLVSRSLSSAGKEADKELCWACTVVVIGHD